MQGIAIQDVERGLPIRVIEFDAYLRAPLEDVPESPTWWRFVAIDGPDAAHPVSVRYLTRLHSTVYRVNVTCLGVERTIKIERLSSTPRRDIIALDRGEFDRLHRLVAGANATLVEKESFPSVADLQERLTYILTYVEAKMMLRVL